MHLLRAACIDCGYEELAALDYDHVGTKRGGVLQLARGGSSVGQLQAEIDECEVRCANCHRRRTRKQLGHRTRTRNLTTPP